MADVNQVVQDAQALVADIEATVAAIKGGLNLGELPLIAADLQALGKLVGDLVSLIGQL